MPRCLQTREAAIKTVMVKDHGQATTSYYGNHGKGGISANSNGLGEGQVTTLPKGQTMKTHYMVALSILPGMAIGAAASLTLHAQASRPST